MVPTSPPNTCWHCPKHRGLLGEDKTPLPLELPWIIKVLMVRKMAENCLVSDFLTIFALQALTPGTPAPDTA